jgi:hypothetical protein
MSWAPRQERAPLIFTACLKKRGFHTERKALAVATPLGLTVYRCDFCMKWHLTRNLMTKRNLARVEQEAAQKSKQTSPDAEACTRRLENRAREMKAKDEKDRKKAEASGTRQRLIVLGLLKE